MTYFDQESNEHYIPYVSRALPGRRPGQPWPSWCDAYDEEVVDAEKNDVRTVLRLHPALAPFKCCCAASVQEAGRQGAGRSRPSLSKYFMVDYDDAGSIGKRYRRQDEIGTPYCITVDFQTVGDDKTPADNCSHHPGP